MNYNFVTGTAINTTKPIGHFTQMVWSATDKVGCGIARNGTRTVVVARYYQPGNFRDQYTANVASVKT